MLVQVYRMRGERGAEIKGWRSGEVQILQIKYYFLRKKTNNVISPWRQVTKILTYMKMEGFDMHPNFQYRIDKPNFLEKNTDLYKKISFPLHQDSLRNYKILWPLLLKGLYGLSWYFLVVHLTKIFYRQGQYAAIWPPLLSHTTFSIVLSQLHT